MAAEIVELKNDLEDPDGEFQNFLDDLREGVTDAVFVAKKKGGDIYISCSTMDKALQIRMLYKLQQALQQIVDFYPAEDEMEEDDE